MNADPPIPPELAQAQRSLDGTFPDGKLNEHDEGGLAIAVGHNPASGQIVVRFAKSVAWFTMPPDTALAFAQRILQQAAMAKGVSVSVSIGGPASQGQAS